MPIYDPTHRVCDNCGRWVNDAEVLYLAHLEMYAEPRIPSLDVPSTREAIEDEWQKLIEQLEAMTDDEVSEAADQVHESLTFQLCPECRSEMHRRVKARRGLLP